MQGVAHIGPHIGPHFGHGGMSEALDRPDLLLDTRGMHRALGEHVVGVGFVGARAAFALGDGTVWLSGDARLGGEAWTATPVHKGAALCLAVDGAGVVTGGDDGRVCRLTDAGVTELASLGRGWVNAVAANGNVVAVAHGKQVHVLSGGATLKVLSHPSTVTGVAFDARGKRIAASHYNGASLWFVAARIDTPRLLEWKGSHIGVAVHPAADAVVTSMQENSLHGWRLANGQHMRMSGYPAKTAAMGFTKSGKWLATSGAEAVVLWPFSGAGPMGKAPTELAGGDAMQCTFVACHPRDETVAAGFADGLLVLADIASGRVLPVCGPGSGRGSVSAIAWSADGSALAWGTEDGFAAQVDLSRSAK